MNSVVNTTAPTGDLGISVIRGGDSHVTDPDPESPPLTLGNIIKHGLPHRGLPDEVNEFRTRNIPHLWRGAWRFLLAKWLHLEVLTGASAVGVLWMKKIKADGTELDYGLASLRVVTTAGVNKIVALLNTTDAVTGVNFKYHGYGTGVTAEASTDTALVTELTTQYNPDNTRPTGTQTIGASANIYRTVATLTPDSGSPVLREHGVFSATTAGTLLDRTLFAAVTLDTTVGDSLQTTYELTLAAGG